MSLKIVGNEDFKSTSNPSNIRGILYKGDGHPAHLSCPATGSFYVDSNSGNAWVCVIANTKSELAWKPYNSVVTAVTFDLNVMEGDIIGQFGPGAWSTISGPASQSGASGAGTQGAALSIGADKGPFVGLCYSYNGAVWSSIASMLSNKAYLATAGSQNAAFETTGHSVVASSETELYNGSAWATSGSVSVAKYIAKSAGTQSAGMVSGGLTDGSTSISTTEFFNGSTWSIGASLSYSKYAFGKVGSVSSAAVIGGNTAGTTIYSVVELFNGTAWSISAPISSTRDAMSTNGAANSINIAGGSDLVNPLNKTELFNGSAWIIGNSISVSRVLASGSGSQAQGLISTGGANLIGTARLSSAELHNQTIHRKLDYNNRSCANNVGIAFSLNVSSTNGYLIRSALPTTRMPPKGCVYISKHSQLSLSPNSVLTVAASSIGAASGGLQTIASATALGDKIAPGMRFYVTSGGASVTSLNNNYYTVQNVSASANTFTIKNPSGASLTVSGYVTPSDRLKLGVTALTVGSGSIVVSLTTNVSFTTTQRLIHVGDTVYLPYGSGVTTGSTYNYGSYMVNSVSITASGGNVSVTAYNAGSRTEATVAFDAEFISAYGCALSNPNVDDLTIGYNGKSRINIAGDDFSNGIS